MLFEVIDNNYQLNCSRSPTGKQMNAHKTSVRCTYTGKLCYDKKDFKVKKEKLPM